MNLAAHEQAKYEKVWAIPEYAHFSPGEKMVPLFCQMVRKRGTLLDIGCGSGKGGLALAQRGFKVTYMDFAKATKAKPFITQNLWEYWPQGYAWDYGYCCDVMEHIPTEHVTDVLQHIRDHCEKTFFLINFQDDQFGKLVGEPLHLTVRPFTWWRDKLWETFSDIVQARDLIGMGAFYVR